MKRMQKLSWRAAVLVSSLALTVIAVPLVSCGGNEGGGSTGSTSESCAYKEAGTSMAPCEKDSDCFGSFCDLSGNPGPYCHVPGANQVNALHGITCSNDAECAHVLPSDAVALGIVGKCQGRSNLDPAVCQYSCEPSD